MVLKLKLTNFNQHIMNVQYDLPHHLAHKILAVSPHLQLPWHRIVLTAMIF